LTVFVEISTHFFERPGVGRHPLEDGTDTG